MPQWCDQRQATLQRTRARLLNAQVDGMWWLWPEGENPTSKRYALAEKVHLLAPFDPVMWDRRRFEMLWNWAYRFEAYTPAAKRLRGHYALPLLWRGQAIGRANLSTRGGVLTPEIGYVGTVPNDRAFAAALEQELQDISVFLGLA